MNRLTALCIALFITIVAATYSGLIVGAFGATLFQAPAYGAALLAPVPLMLAFPVWIVYKLAKG